MEAAELRYHLAIRGAGDAERPPDSADVQPWRHPYLTHANLSAFRKYSERVWEFALEHHRRHQAPLRAAFTVNMCQNMYKWAGLAQARGVEATLFPHIADTTALSRPEWEEFDGEFRDVLDGPGFLAAHPQLRPMVSCEYVPIASEGSEMLSSWLQFKGGEPEAFLKLQSEALTVRHDALCSFEGFYTYYTWARRLADFDVIYGCSNPFAAYASGRPYLVASVGGDVIYDCGKRSDFGLAHLIAFNTARFQTVSNPHTLAHCRRLGLANPVYLPYPMDDRKYCPAPGRARAEWEQRYGGSVYVLAPSRIDGVWKGFGPEMFDQLKIVAKAHPEVRFVFLGWGQDQEGVRSWIADAGLSQQVIVLNPVGKRRLIDYYRSCDIVLDHFAWGYYGVTALEAAAIGKPVVMKMRDEHYTPLYAGDAAPVENVKAMHELAGVLARLVDDRAYRTSRGEAMRGWLVRNHGEDRTMPLLMALLRLTADQAQLPKDLRSPLLDPLSTEEVAYHESCLLRGAVTA